MRLGAVEVEVPAAGESETPLVDAGPAIVATGEFLNEFARECQRLRSAAPSDTNVDETANFVDIVNGERNNFNIHVENKGDYNITLKSVQGAVQRRSTVRMRGLT